MLIRKDQTRGDGVDANARRQAALRDRLRALPHIEGKGGAKRWWEAHYFIGISAARGRRLARLFRQKAMVALKRRDKARLIWVF